MTLLDFFSGLFPFPVDDSFIESCCILREHDAQMEDITDVSAKDKGLLKADILKGLSRASMGWQSKVSSSAFSNDQRGDAISAADRRSMLIEANRLYIQYGEPSSVTKLNAINVWSDEKNCKK